MAGPQSGTREVSGNKAISNIIIVIAMQTEAQPVVNKFHLIQDPHSPFPQGVPWLRYHGKYKDLNINLIWPGKDPNSGNKTLDNKTLLLLIKVNKPIATFPFISGVDSVGTISSALVTYAAIQALKPDLIINAGTAGGFKDRGATVGDVFIISDCAFHDRRIPIPVFDLYGVGSRKAFETPNLVKELNLKVGKLSTGDSLDMFTRRPIPIIRNRLKLPKQLTI